MRFEASLVTVCALACPLLVAAPGAIRAQVYASQWGSPGAGNGQFNAPRGIARNASGDIYVADTGNHRIQQFDATGGYLAQWGSFGTAVGEFSSPAGVAIDGSGNLYVADTGNDRIQKFSSGGTPLLQWGQHGSGTGEFDGPAGITVAPDGSIYVADTNNHRIQQFSDNGAFVRAWGTGGTGPGEFASPTGVAVTGGAVFVTDTGNQRVQVFTIEGAYRRQWGGAGAALGQFDAPRGIASNGSNQVFVVDSNNGRVQQFAGPHTYAQSWSGPVIYPFGASDVAIAGADILVANQGGYRVERCTSAFDYLGGWSTEELGPPSSPSSVATALDGSSYVGSGYKIRRYSSAGIELAQWGTQGSGPGQFDRVRGVAVVPSGDVYVADGNNHRIQKFSSSGVYASQWPIPVSKGINDIAAESDGSVYVASSWSEPAFPDPIQKGEVAHYDGSGTSLATWPYTNSVPSAVETDGLGHVYVMLSGGETKELSVSGVEIAQWSVSGPGLAANSAGDVFVAAGYLVHKFSTGMFQSVWGAQGDGDGRLNLPGGVVCDTQGNIFVVDTGNNRVEKFAPGPGVDVPRLPGSPTHRLSAAPNPARRSLRFTLELPADEDVTVQLFDVRGRWVQDVHRGLLTAGVHEFPWTLERANGSRMSPGIYLVRVTAAGTAQAVSRIVLLP